MASDRPEPEPDRALAAVNLKHYFRPGWKLGFLGKRLPVSWRGQSWQSSLALQRPSHFVRGPTTGRGACTPALLVGYHRQTGTV